MRAGKSDEYARQDFNEVRDDGKNHTEHEVDPASSVRFEPDHNHDISMNIEREIESESSSYVMKKELIIKHEGWERSNLLPEEWMFKQIAKGSTKDNKWYSTLHYLFDNRVTFESMRTMLDHMKPSPKHSEVNITDCQELCRSKIDGRSKCRQKKNS